MVFNMIQYDQWIFHSDCGILFSSEKQWTVKPWKHVEEPYMHITKWKNLIWKDNILYGSNDTRSQERQNTVWSQRTQPGHQGGGAALVGENEGGVGAPRSPRPGHRAPAALGRPGARPGDGEAGEAWSPGEQGWGDAKATTLCFCVLQYFIFIFNTSLWVNLLFSPNL